MLKIGVLGAGHLGKIHIRLLKEIADFELVGFYDPDEEKTAFTEQEFGVKAFADLDELISLVDVVDIVTPTLSHYECAVKAITQGKHIFVEKPLTHTTQEAQKLVDLVKETGIKAQVGHVERFNPAFIAASQQDLKPMFIEGHRLAEFKPRGTDVSVVLDLMIHDIDIILSIVDSPISLVMASGVAVISDNIDIANARIEFENGCVANLTASRVSLKTERKLRIFQKNAYITIDFHKKETNVFKMRELGENEEPASIFVIDPGEGRLRKEINYIQPKLQDINAIKHELELFAKAINENTRPVVDIVDGYRSLELAHIILDKIEMLFKKSEML